MSQGTTGTEDGWAVLSYVFSGILLYGGVGWLGDHFLKTGFLLPIGLVLGLVVSFYVIVRRYGQTQ